AVGRPDAGVEDAEVVVDLGDGSHGGARILGRRLLLDRDRRGQSLDRVDVRLLHLLQELASVGRQALDVSALALGVDRVERERGLPRARQPRDDDQAVPRDLEIDVLEVVLASPTDDDAVTSHGGADPFLPALRANATARDIVDAPDASSARA